MKIAYYLWEKPIELTECRINILVIENPKALVGIIDDILKQTRGENGELIMSDNGEILDMSKELDFVANIFDMNINDRKILNKVYGKLNDIAYSSDYYLNTNSTLTDLSKYIQSITDELSYPIYYNVDTNISGRIKALNVKLAEEYDSLLEQVINYITVVKEFCSVSCFVFLNLRSYLTKEELEEFYKHLFYNKINVLLIENYQRERICDCEVFRIIDEDLCEIY